MTDASRNGLQKQTINLFGESYTLVTDEPLDRMERAIVSLHKHVQQYAQQVSDNKRAIILCALQLAIDGEHLKEQLTAYKEKEEALARLAERVHTLG